MPRKGYRSITLPDSLYDRLAEYSKQYGTSPQKLIASFLESSSSVASFDETFQRRKVSNNPCDYVLGTFNKSSIKSLNADVNNADAAGKCTVQGFAEYLAADMKLSPKSVALYRMLVAKAMKECGDMDTESLRSFLSGIDNQHSYASYLRALRHYFIDYLHSPESVWQIGPFSGSLHSPTFAMSGTQESQLMHDSPDKEGFA